MSTNATRAIYDLVHLLAGARSRARLRKARSKKQEGRKGRSGEGSNRKWDGNLEERLIWERSSSRRWACLRCS